MIRLNLGAIFWWKFGSFLVYLGSRRAIDLMYPAFEIIIFRPLWIIKNVGSNSDYVSQNRQWDIWEP